MKLAFFTSIVPDDHPVTGFEIANSTVIQGLRELGHDLIVFGFRQPRQATITDPNTVILDVRNLENSAASVLDKLTWLARAIQKKLPLSASKLADFSESQLLHEVQQAGPFDGYIFNSYQMAAVFPQLLGDRAIFLAHNIEHVSAQENARFSKSRIESWLYRRDARLLRDIETQLCDAAGHVWFLSENDQKILACSDERSTVIPLVISGAQTRPSKQTPKYDLALIGTWSWKPNEVGLHWFLNEVVPLIDNRVTIAIAGTVPDTLQVHDPRVEYCGRVDDAGVFLDAARVIPLISRGGTGVQLKTIEAFQSGFACVATPSSVRGIAHIPKNCTIADSPEEFSAAIQALLSRCEQGCDVRMDGTPFWEAQHAAMRSALTNGLRGIG